MELIVYVDRLKEGKKELFSGEISTDFLEDKNLFENTLSLAGEAYVSGDHLILRLRAKLQPSSPALYVTNPFQYQWKSTSPMLSP